ncbi:eCIS core domain-containing protein [Gelatiniphilus marinus]|uniref:DUF4157 domain-containing protein n=1 Tax=Gelatiniphilus marinus TaxID=1759464 RepID=A0ABW5JQI0_9FLAO
MFKSATADRASAKSSNSSPFHRETEQETFIQPKLNVGKPNDKYEIEADTIADKVVNQTNLHTKSSFFPPVTNIQKKDIQKQEDNKIIQEKPIAQTITPVVQLEAVEDEETIQEKYQNSKNEDALQKKQEDHVENVQAKTEKQTHPLANLGTRIQQNRGRGKPLANPILSKMQQGFGADFSGVKIHTDSESVSMNRDLGSRAFTNKNNIFFNAGEFNPQSKNGQTLLAHELTHTIQQGASVAIQKPEANLETPLADTTVEQDNETADVFNTNTTNQAAIESELPEIDTRVETQEEDNLEGGQESLENSENIVEAEDAEASESVEVFPMSPEEDPAFNALQDRVEGAAQNQQTTAPAQQEAQAAQVAAAIPSNERMGAAQANQVEVMDEQEPEAFNAEAFKAALMQRIESMQLPENQEEATDFEDNNNIQEISDAASEDASQAQEHTAGPISEATAATPNVDTVPEREVIALPEAPIGSAPTSVNANTAMPNPRPNSQVTQPLQENMQEVDQQMIDNEVTEEQLARSNEPEFTSALDSRSEARTNTDTAPSQFRQQESQALGNSQQQAEAASATNLESMHGDRSNILNEVVSQQTETGTQNTAERERISNEINDIYNTTKTDVEAILEELDAKVTEKFDKAARQAKLKFENYVTREMNRYKDRRYSGLRGAARWLVDKFKGLPDEVNQFFVDGRALYIAEMDRALTDISNYVAEQLTKAQQRIETGKQDVTTYVESLPENLQSIGEEASEAIQDRFDQLSDDVNSKQDELIDSLAQQYNDSLQEVDARIEEMQAANRGLIDMALDAINGVIDTIRQLKQLISDLLAEIRSSIAIIMADPIGFVSNLFAGVKQGFDNFVSNIQTHLIAGFVQWLTGALGPVGITIPENLFSLKGIFSLVMQVLGLTWDYMRQKAVKLLGEPVVRAMEFGLEMFQIIKEKGIEGIWEYIKEQFTDLKETIMDSIKDMLIVQVIQAGIRWLVSLLIPGAGFIKAIMAIKDFIVFFVESAIMLIPTLIEAIRAMAVGSISMVANAVERGLATLLPLVIKLFARIIGLGGLVKKVQKIIKKIRKRIDRAINKLILKAKKAARKLLRRLGIGRSGEEDDGDEDVKQLAERRVIEGLGQDFTTERARQIVTRVLADLRPQGLDNLQITPIPNLEDEFYLDATASPLSHLLKLRPKIKNTRPAVTLAVRITLNPEQSFQVATENREIIPGYVRPYVVEGQPGIESGTVGTREFPSRHSQDGTFDFASLATRGRVSGSVGGAILIPSTPSNVIELLTWSNGGIQTNVCHNDSHAEHQFVEWFNTQSTSFKAGINQVELSLQSLSPCAFCVSDLIRVINDSNLNSSTVFTISWSKVFATKGVCRELDSTDESLNRLRNAGWNISGPMPSGEAATSEEMTIEQIQST